MKRIAFVVYFLCFTAMAMGQHYSFRGIVTDSTLREPLPFVNVFNRSTRAYTASGIDGKFAIEAKTGDTIAFSYVGYHSRAIVLGKNLEDAIVVLSPSVEELRTIEFEAGENPAWRIIRNAIKNRKQNDPENLHAFRYKAYHKFFATTEGANFDSAQLNTRSGKFLNSHHLFMNETFSERKVLRPSYDEEIVLGNRMSGVKDPFFAILATNFQPFTFYNDHITIFDKNYINPIAPGTFDRYEFDIADTLVAGSDSTYLIVFEPREGKVFDGLRGILYINTAGFAVEHVLAEPMDPKALLRIKIQQKYIRIANSWFPLQLNTEFILREMQVASHPIKYVHRSYLTEQEINPALTPKDFGPINLHFAPNANRQTESFWIQHRVDTLSFKEKNTYSFYDSLPARQLATLNSILKIGEAFLSGKVQYKNLYFPLRHLLRINGYEDYRFGFGLETSERVSNLFILDAFVGYGVRDKATKYGASLRVNLLRTKDLFLKASFTKDVNEPGASDFMASSSSIAGPENLRNWLTTRMDSVEQFKLQLHIRPLPFSSLSMFALRESRNPTYAYSYRYTDEDSTETFHVGEVGIQFRFAFGETYSRLRNTRVVTGYKYPQLNFRFSHGRESFSSNSFTKAELRVDHQSIIRGIGKLTINVHAGIMTPRVPYPYLFNGKGAETTEFTLNNFIIPNYFQTMGVYEFTSDRFVNVMLRQHVGRLVSTRSKYFRPELTLLHHAGIGNLSADNAIHDMPLQSYERGYLEGGAVIDHLVRFNYLNVAYIGLGGGVFYRYGPYSRNTTSENFAYKLSLSFSF